MEDVDRVAVAAAPDTVCVNKGRPKGVEYLEMFSCISDVDADRVQRAVGDWDTADNSSDNNVFTSAPRCQNGVVGKALYIGQEQELALGHVSGSSMGLIKRGSECVAEKWRGNATKWLAGCSSIGGVALNNRIFEGVALVVDLPQCVVEIAEGPRPASAWTSQTLEYINWDIYPSGSSIF